MLVVLGPCLLSLQGNKIRFVGGFKFLGTNKCNSKCIHRFNRTAIYRTRGAEQERATGSARVPVDFNTCFSCVVAWLVGGGGVLEQPYLSRSTARSFGSRILCLFCQQIEFL
jgi:hypothetical protein